MIVLVVAVGVVLAEDSVCWVLVRPHAMALGVPVVWVPVVWVPVVWVPVVWVPVDRGRVYTLGSCAPYLPTISLSAALVALMFSLLFVLNGMDWVAATHCSLMERRVFSAWSAV